MKLRPSLSIARRNMLAGRVRTLFSVAGVAIATLLLAFVVALYRGWNEETVAYIEDTKADLWVVGNGADSFFTPSIMFTPAFYNVDGLDGVDTVSRLIGKPMKLRTEKDGWDSYVIGFEPGKPGGPVGIVKGSGNPRLGEIVIDDVLAKTSGLDVGDEVRAALRTLKVVGISRGGNLVLAQLSFVTYEEARILLSNDAIINFLLVKADPGQSSAVADRVKTQLKGVDAFEADAFAANSREVLQRSILPILLVIVIMAVLVGTIVVGLTVYTAVVEKEREYGILKAVGVPGRGLVRVVLEQSFVCGALGFALGIVLALVVAEIAQMLLPQVSTSFRASDIALILGATALMSLVASIIPTMRVARVDTLSVFKA
jgi:putative ABC transport system permease protein